MSFKNNSSSSLRSSLVEKVLEQGQRLRNAMVRSILDNDPFYSEVPSYRKPQVFFSELDEKEALEGPESDVDKSKLLRAFLQGDCLSVTDEMQALNTLRSMSSDDYHKLALYLNSSCNLKNSTTRLNEDVPFVPPIELDVKETPDQSDFKKCLKYVDSLMVTVHSLKLNEAGNRKVCSSEVDAKYKYPPSASHSYFIEYQIPGLIVKSAIKTKAKVQSGLDANNTVRMCSKKLHSRVVYFKQTSVHDLENLQQINLEDVQIKFQVSCRTLRQKKSNIIGCCKFDLSNVAKTDHLSGCFDLPLRLNDDTPIIVGTIKVAFELGCSRLYFGKEFKDIITSSITKESLVEDVFIQNTPISVPSITEIVSSEEQENLKEHTIPLTSINRENKNCGSTNRTVYGKLRKVIEKPAEVQEKPVKLRPAYTLPKGSNSVTKEHSETLLFGLIYVSEAQYVNNCSSSYFNCQPFCLDTVIFSRIINDTSKPVFNFYQLIPLLYDECLLNRFRDNHMILEFVAKRENSEEVIGVTKLPLYQFYIAYKNPNIVKYLIQNKAPIVALDWWEPITHPISEETTGQVQILLALGTESQIKNLELERGFKNEIVTARLGHTFIPRQIQLAGNDIDGDHQQTTVSKQPHQSTTVIKQAVISKQPDVSERTFDLTRNSQKQKKSQTIAELDKQKKTKIVKKIDIAIQSDLKMESSRESNQKQDNLGALLEQLMAIQKKNVCVENSTSTEATDLPKQNLNELNKQSEEVLNDLSKQSVMATNVELKKTSDLLDSLQKALNTNKQNFCSNSHRAMSCMDKAKDCFKAHVHVEGALHLPMRKKCKSKRSKTRGSKQEEIPPTTYVTFETVPGAELKVSQIIYKSSSPDWNFRCDVVLPTELLINSQKRLIFKVWNKSNSSPQPNYQNDQILGFAALDLTVLIAGLPTVQGWFNIVDFTSKCNGQIKVNVTPLENLAKYQNDRKLEQKPVKMVAHDLNEEKDEPNELSRALKRKFSELDEITQRLRLRLSSVTNDELDASNDDLADEFEHDINTLCVEDDFDMINFEQSIKKQESDANLGLLQIEISPELTAQTNEMIPALELKMTESGSLTSLDKHLIEGKQRIDSLLEKLSLISDSEGVFPNRYVSGCSASNESVVTKEANREAQLDASLFQQLCVGSYDLTPTLDSVKTTSNSSSSSLLTTCTDSRPAPDGAGCCSEDITLNSKSDST